MRPEVVLLLQAAQCVFDVPEAAIDLEQLLFERAEFPPRDQGRASTNFKKPVKFAFDIGLRRGSGDSFPFDAQYRNLVDQFADRNRSEDVHAACLTGTFAPARAGELDKTMHYR